MINIRKQSNRLKEHWNYYDVAGTIYYLFLYLTVTTNISFSNWTLLENCRDGLVATSPETCWQSTTPCCSSSLRPWVSSQNETRLLGGKEISSQLVMHSFPKNNHVLILLSYNCTECLVICFLTFDAGWYLRVPLIKMLFLWENNLNTGVKGLSLWPTITLLTITALLRGGNLYPHYCSKSACARRPRWPLSAPTTSAWRWRDFWDHVPLQLETSFFNSSLAPSTYMCLRCIANMHCLICNKRSMSVMFSDIFLTSVLMHFLCGVVPVTRA